MAKLQNSEFLPNYTVRQIHRKMVKSDLISGGNIRPGPDMAGYENLAGFRPKPGLDVISGATLMFTVDSFAIIKEFAVYMLYLLFVCESKHPNQLIENLI